MDNQLSVSFLVGNTFTHPKVFNRNSGKVSLSTMDYSITESLGLLIKTTRGELLGDPDFGTNLISFIFSNNDESLEENIVEDICKAVEKYEKRVTITTDDIKVEYTDTIVNIHIAYTVNVTGARGYLNLSIER